MTLAIFIAFWVAVVVAVIALMRAAANADRDAHDALQRHLGEQGWGKPMACHRPRVATARIQEDAAVVTLRPRTGNVTPLGGERPPIDPEDAA